MRCNYIQITHVPKRTKKYRVNYSDKNVKNYKLRDCMKLSDRQIRDKFNAVEICGILYCKLCTELDR